MDVVEYTGLIPGETYTVSGILMDKATGGPLLVDEAEVTAEVEFTSESADGTVEADLYSGCQHPGGNHHRGL